jgi:nucleotidyltransferase/DNA polymerase involved in DNA repair
MTSNARRASQAAVDTLHRLTAQALARQLREAHKSGQSVSAALLSSSIAFLKLAGVADPAPPTRKVDRLARSLPSADELERGMAPPK